MDKSRSETAGRRGWRGTVTIVLLTLLFFTAAAANFSIWLQTTISNTDDFVSAFAPLPEDEAVAEELGQALADAAIDPEQTASNISARLPQDLQPLAVPVATALNELAANAATRLVESDAFAAIWERTLQAAHSALLDLLRFRQAANELRADVSEAADALGDRLETLGVDVTISDSPRVTVVQAGQDSIIVNALRFIYTTGWVFPALFLVLAVIVVVINTDRRRAALRLGGVTAAAMVFDLVMMRILRADLAGHASNSLAEDALRNAWDTVTAGARRQTWLILLVAVVVMGLARYVGTDIGAQFEGYPSPTTAAFLDQWGTLVNALVIIVALGILLLVPSMTFGLALIITLVAVVAVLFISYGKRQAQSARMP
jgi:hypothetical protein